MTEFRGPFGSRGMGSLIKWVMSPEGSEAHRKYFEQLEKDNMFNVTVPHQDCICYKCKDRKDNSMTNKKCTCKSPRPLPNMICMECGLMWDHKPTYTAGDRVMIKLTEGDAINLNKGHCAICPSNQIVTHEPVKPMVRYMTLENNHMCGPYMEITDARRHNLDSSVTFFKISINPHTKEASIEVVETP